LGVIAGLIADRVGKVAVEVDLGLALLIYCRRIAYLRVVGAAGEAEVVEHQPNVFAQHC
jgi:hypothetical protein